MIKAKLNPGGAEPPPPAMVDRARILLRSPRARVYSQGTAARLADEFGATVQTAWGAMGQVVAEEMDALMARYEAADPIDALKKYRADIRRKSDRRRKT